MKPLARAKKKSPTRKVAATKTPAVKVVKVANPGLAAMQRTKRRQSEQCRAISAIMLQQKRKGIPVTEIARQHRLSTKTIYQRLNAAKRANVRVRATTAVQQPAIVRPADQENAYLRGRVDQLESVFAQIFNVGVKKLLRALAP